MDRRLKDKLLTNKKLVKAHKQKINQGMFTFVSHWNMCLNIIFLLQYLFIAILCVKCLVWHGPRSVFVFPQHLRKVRENRTR